VGVTIQAKKASLYVRSRAPRDFRPVMPSETALLPRSGGAGRDSARFPGRPSCATSGITIRLPVKTSLSPALARSTISPRKITSNLLRQNRNKRGIYVLGMEPVGISLLFSCIRHFCQSPKVEPSRFNRQLTLFMHTSLGQTRGSVYRKTCSTPSTAVRQSMHWNTPRVSSGRTSLVRVTVPEIETSLPI